MIHSTRCIITGHNFKFVYLERIKTITIFLIYYGYEKSEYKNLLEYYFFGKFLKSSHYIFFKVQTESKGSDMEIVQSHTMYKWQIMN